MCDFQVHLEAPRFWQASGTVTIGNKLSLVFGVRRHVRDTGSAVSYISRKSAVGNRGSLIDFLEVKTAYLLWDS